MSLPHGCCSAVLSSLSRPREVVCHDAYCSAPSIQRESSIAEERRVAVPAEERSAQKRKHFDELAAREEIEVISVNVMH
uniref:Uncharacterized protein n=1 Tax=Oryza meridionalis TaxID=40149 RepID=A0A0E0DE21_9ORYZ